MNVFKHIFVILVLLCVSGFWHNTQAQDIRVGGMAGLNISNVVGPDVDNNQIMPGSMVAPYFEIYFADHIAVRHETMLISQKGTSTNSFRINYLDLPLLGVYQATPNLFVLAGVQYSVLYGASKEGVENNEELTETLNVNDFAPVIGALWRLPDTKMDLGLRYVRGLTRLDAREESKTFNSVFQLTFSYNFVDKHL